MHNVEPSQKIYTKQSEVSGAGRGVFAAIDIPKDAVIEICPAIALSEHDVENLSDNMLVTYLFFHGVQKEKAFVALGFGSLYNHAHTPNAAYVIDENAMTITFTAIENILKDTEITFNYSAGNSQARDPLWFEV